MVKKYFTLFKNIKFRQKNPEVQVRISNMFFFIKKILNLKSSLQKYIFSFLFVLLFLLEKSQVRAQVAPALSSVANTLSSSHILSLSALFACHFGQVPLNPFLFLLIRKCLCLFISAYYAALEIIQLLYSNLN